MKTYRKIDYFQQYNSIYENRICLKIYLKAYVKIAYASSYMLLHFLMYYIFINFQLILIQY